MSNINYVSDTRLIEFIDLHTNHLCDKCPCGRSCIRGNSCDEHLDPRIDIIGGKA